MCSEHTRRRHGFVWALLGVQEHNGNLAQTDPLGTAEPRSHNMKHKETDLYALGLGETSKDQSHLYLPGREMRISRTEHDSE